MTLFSPIVVNKMSSEVEETLKRLIAHKGVIGTIVVNNDGIPIKSTLDNHTTTQYAGLINQLVDQVSLFFSYLKNVVFRVKKHKIKVG